MGFQHGKRNISHHYSFLEDFLLSPSVSFRVLLPDCLALLSPQILLPFPLFLIVPCSPKLLSLELPRDHHRASITCVMLGNLVSFFLSLTYRLAQGLSFHSQRPGIF